jgi:hypothetical protein
VASSTRYGSGGCRDKGPASRPEGSAPPCLVGSMAMEAPSLVAVGILLWFPKRGGVYVAVGSRDACVARRRDRAERRCV